MLRFGGGGEGRGVLWLSGGSRPKLREAGSFGGAMFVAEVILAGDTAAGVWCVDDISLVAIPDGSRPMAGAGITEPPL